MYINFERNFMFVHIPKTGGQSIRRALGFDERKMDPHPIPSELGGHMLRMFRFTFVRNPWDRVVSAFYYSRKMAHRGTMKGHPVRRQILEENFSDADTFVKTILSPDVVGRNMHFRPQIRWVASAKVSYIGRFETIQEDFQRIASIVGVEAELPHENRMQRSVSYREELSPESFKKIAKLYDDDIRCFGYRW